MNKENQHIEYKSLVKVKGSKADFRSLAETCVCLANTQGGWIIVGIEDKELAPPEGQKIAQVTINKTISRLRYLTSSVGLAEPKIHVHENGGEYFSFRVLPSSRTIATTSSGKVFLRISDKCYPVSGDELTRLAAEKNAFQWELVPIRSAKLAMVSPLSIKKFVDNIRASERVKKHVKSKDDHELLVHYNLVEKDYLTNLGVLWLGTPSMRSRIAYPANAQYIVYNEQGEKVRKENWHEYDKNPLELLLEIEQQATELQYFYEFPQGLLRQRIYHYPKELVRELLINAIAHKSYTISGDIFIEVHPNRLVITNPGRLPLGITKDNILHTVHRRNPHLIRIFHDLKLMEGEGSGYDLIYEIDSRDVKPFPEIISEYDYTKVIQSSQIIDEDTLFLIEYIAKHFTLSQKDFITLGIIARERKILSTRLSKQLQLSEEDRLRSYVKHLLEQKILIVRGKKKGREYLINPVLISQSKLQMSPTLKTIEQHQLKALIQEDLKVYPNSQMRDIRNRMPDIDQYDIKKAVYTLVKEGLLEHSPDRGHRKYWLAKKKTVKEEKI